MASLLCFVVVFKILLLMFGSGFQNWDLRIRPLGGNLTDSPIFRSKIAYASIQRPQIKKFDPRFVDDLLYFPFVFVFGRRKARVDFWLETRTSYSRVKRPLCPYVAL